MRKPNMIFLSIIAMAALLPHTSRWIDTPQDDPLATSTSPLAEESKPVSAVPAKKTDEPVAAANFVPQLPAPSGAAAQSTAAPATEPTADEADRRHVLPIDEPTATTEPLAELEEVYLTEVFDPEWAMPLEESFHSVFDAVRLQDSTVEQAECRTTLCRFAITHKNSAAQDAFVQAFLQSRLLPLNQVTIAQHSQKTPDGNIAAVYFLARNELAQVHH